MRGSKDVVCEIALHSKAVILTTGDNAHAHTILCSGNGSSKYFHRVSLSEQRSISLD